MLSALREPADRPARLLAGRTVLAKWREGCTAWWNRVRGTTPDEQIVGSAGDVDVVRRMVHGALRKSRLSSCATPFTCTATLTLKVLKRVDTTGGVRFSVFGITGSAGVAHDAADTQTLTITFTPTAADPLGQCDTLPSLAPRGGDAYCLTSSAIHWKSDWSNPTVDRLPSATLLRNIGFDSGTELRSTDHVTVGDDRLWDQQLVPAFIPSNAHG